MRTEGKKKKRGQWSFNRARNLFRMGDRNTWKALQRGQPPVVHVVQVVERGWEKHPENKN